MEGNASKDQEQSGKLVAFEGDADTITTQLRLLPPSPKILVLPSFDNAPSQDKQGQLFDARAYIREVHEAFIERIEIARAFLRYSTTAQPRLVFMNGGSVRGRTTCISRISENLTYGDIGEAETLFNDIARHGANRLLKAESDVDQMGPELEMNLEEDTSEMPEDPTTMAVEAAEILYRETATLQSEDIGLQENIFDGFNLRSTRSYTTGVRGSVRGISDVRLEPLATHDMVELKNHELFGSGSDDAVPSILTARSRSSIAECRHFPLRRSVTAKSSYTTALTYQVEDSGDGDYDEDILSHWDEGHRSMPPTPVAVYGQAFLVEVQTTSPEKRLRRVRSVDRFFLNKSRCREQFHGARPVSSIGLGGVGLQTLPRKTFLKASETTIKKLSASIKSTSSTEDNKDPEARLFIDRATDTRDITVEHFAIEEPETEEYVPIFPLIEDLIISFNDGHPSEISDLIIRSYKNGSYPMAPSIFPSDSTNPMPASHPEAANIVNSPAPSLRTEKDGPGYESRPSYDPYSSDDSYSASTERPWPPRENLFRAAICIRRPNSLTPPRSPQTPHGVPETFLEFPVNATSSILEIQNSLRQLLSIHLPSGENGYSQHYFSVAPEVNRLWKPIFGNDQLSSVGNNGTAIDQIIALGCETGVTKEFCDQICWHIEKLGMNSGGYNRSAKLDLTYLIANMMQTLSTLPLKDRSTLNPLSDPSVLATLLVPQLEAYLAANSSTRLLILHYTSNQLPTMVALRKLLGSHHFKVAGILNSLALDSPSSRCRPQLSISAHSGAFNDYLPSSTYHASPLNSSLVPVKGDSTLEKSQGMVSKPKQSHSYISFAKANYVLPSTATSTEIASFVAEIRKSLVEKSALYAYKPPPKPAMVDKGIQALPIPPIPKTPNKHETSTMPTGNQSVPGSARGYDQDRDSLYPASSFKTPTIRRERENRKKWDNFYVGDEDSDDDEFDKMILGRKHAKIVPEMRMAGPAPQKKNMQKALKWLGVS
ncbi:uncharacterized protein BP5553_02832 [Venustampulla echinocandica]|uniref:Uncharacterized protein n=1 Tax=Venustampulla echinocandica TaxID=2656787 RepID=A0A370TSI2_9HELO|nr:uncharacterized protein BP5553_02832 [Venustampulla echinocandica]RDL38492.1 hypothetical protein BP5553_02832 [Venustampulla echinocandica]